MDDNAAINLKQAIKDWHAAIKDDGDSGTLEEAEDDAADALCDILLSMAADYGMTEDMMAIAASSAIAIIASDLSAETRKAAVENIAMLLVEDEEDEEPAT